MKKSNHINIILTIICLAFLAATLCACANLSSCKHDDLARVAAVSATCTENGHVEYWHCGKCSKNFADSSATKEIVVAIPATGHKATKVPAKKATCTDNGNVEHWHCELCSKNFGDEAATKALVNVTLPATGHETSIIHANSATCTLSGNVEYWHCHICLKNFEDADGETELAEVTVLATGHNAVEVPAKSATCTLSGNVAYWHCESCSKNFEDEATTKEITSVTIPAEGHRATKVPAKSATCTVDGNVEHWHCDACSKNFENESCEVELDEVAIFADGHKATGFPAKSATCTENGNVAYWHCDACSKNFDNEHCVTELDEVIIPAAHDFGDYAYDYEQKVYRRECGVCGDGEQVGAGSAEYPLLARDEDELYAIVDGGAANSFFKLANDIAVTTVSFNKVYTLPEGSTLDLGGHTVSATRAPGCFVVQGTNVTVQNGTVNLTNGGDYSLFIGDEGDDNSVTVKNINSNAGFNVYNCVATIVDCNVDASACTYYALWADEHSTIIVESGTYVGGATACIHSTANASDEEGNGNVTLKGGTFDGNVIATVKTEIFGGVINGTVKLTDYNNCPAYLLVGKDYAETLNIVCGKDGCELVQTTDGEGNKIYQQKLAE